MPNVVPLEQNKKQAMIAMVDLHSKILDALPLPGSIFFIFMQFPANFVQIIGWHPPFRVGVLDPSLDRMEILDPPQFKEKWNVSFTLPLPNPLLICKMFTHVRIIGSDLINVLFAWTLSTNHNTTVVSHVTEQTCVFERKFPRGAETRGFQTLVTVNLRL